MTTHPVEGRIKIHPIYILIFVTTLMLLIMIFSYTPPEDCECEVEYSWESMALEGWKQYITDNNLTYVKGEFNCRNFTNAHIDYLAEYNIPVSYVVISRYRNLSRRHAITGLFISSQTNQPVNLSEHTIISIDGVECK